MKDECGVYMLKFDGDERIYIGCSKYSYRERVKTHLSALRRGAHTNRNLQDGYNKNKNYSIKLIIPAEYLTFDEMRMMEQKSIEKRQKNNIPLYNYSLEEISEIGRKAFETGKENRIKLKAFIEKYITNVKEQ